MAVANKMVIANLEGPGAAAFSLMLFGGPVLFLLAQSWYLRTVLHVSPRLPLVGSATLTIGGVLTLAAPPYAALILASVGLTTLVIFDKSGIPRVHGQEEI